MAKNMGMGCRIGSMIPLIRGIGNRIVLMEKENMFGIMVETI